MTAFTHFLYNMLGKMAFITRYMGENTYLRQFLGMNERLGLVMPMLTAKFDAFFLPGFLE